MSAAALKWKQHPLLRSENRNFLSLRPHSHIPGYTGHCPRLRDRFGETFGDSTWAAFAARNFEQNRSSMNRSAPFEVDSEDPNNNYYESMAPNVTSQDGTDSTEYCWHPTIHRVTSVVPVYAPGWYAPCYPFSNYSLRDPNDQVRSDEKKLELENQMLALPRLVPTVNHGSIFENLHALPEHITRKKHRVYDQPPVIGYQGHVPRLLTTDTGLGLRYSEAARLSLELFKRRPEQRKPTQLMTGPSSERCHWHYLTVPYCLN